MLSAHFGELSAQSFISESQAMVKLSTKLDQLSKAPSTSLTFPSGKKVTGDSRNSDRVQYYRMILQNLQAKGSSGNPVSTTKSAYEATKAAFAAKGSFNVPDPKSDNPIGISWLDNEALEYLTH